MHQLKQVPEIMSVGVSIPKSHKKNSVIQNFPKYIACLASYSDYEKDKDSIVRITCTITDTDTDKVVDRIEYWNNQKDFIDIALKGCTKLAEKYDSHIITLHHTMPLTKCPCGGCENYLESIFTKQDYIDIQMSMKNE